MGQRTSAAVLRRRDEPYTIEQVELPGIGAGQVLVRLVATGICHTDLLPRDLGMGGDSPMVLGHEGAGVVEEVGPGVRGIAAGDHVVLSFDSCGACGNCFGGHPAYCDSFLVRNLFGGEGDVGPARSERGDDVAIRWFGQSSFAGHAVATARNVVVVDRSMPFELAAPLGCGILTGAATVTDVLGVSVGDALVVTGVGGVGMAAVMAAAHAGASRIVAVDRLPARLELARSLGATHAVAADDVEDLAAAIVGTGGPVAHAFDTTGHPGVIRSSVDALAARGTCAVVGNQAGDVVLGPGSLIGGKALTAVFVGDAVPQLAIPRLVELWRRGALPVERLVTTYPLAAVNDAERDLRAGDVVKPVLLP